MESPRRKYLDREQTSRRNPPPTMYMRDLRSSGSSSDSFSSSERQARYGFFAQEANPPDLQASAPVLRHAPTPRTVSFVEPGNRISGCSSRVETLSDSPEAHGYGATEKGHSQSSDSAFPRKSCNDLPPCSSFQQRMQSRSLSRNTSGGHQAGAVTTDQETSNFSASVPPRKSLDGLYPRTIEHLPPRRSCGFLRLRTAIWTPVGVLWTVYYLLIIAWGAALFIVAMGWTNLTSALQAQWIEVCSQVRFAAYHFFISLTDATDFS